MKTAKRYSMELRAASAEATRERILKVAGDAFLTDWYDAVTLASIAERAGVSGQTLLNHFGSKDGLFAAAHARLAEDLVMRRYRPEPGDVAGAIDALVEDYEITGDAVVRLLALEGRVPAVEPLLATGRAGHRTWVQTMFEAPELVPELIVVTDVYAWKLLRRDQRLSRKKTTYAIRGMVEALLERRTR